MKTKEWKYLDYEDCPKCGGACEVLSEIKDDNSFYDQEEVRCAECGLAGLTSVDGDENDNGDCIGRVQWEDFEEEEQ